MTTDSPEATKQYAKIGALYILEWLVLAAALGFITGAFGWKAAAAWALIQWYANLRADNRSTTQ